MVSFENKNQFLGFSIWEHFWEQFELIKKHVIIECRGRHLNIMRRLKTLFKMNCFNSSLLSLKWKVQHDNGMYFLLKQVGNICQFSPYTVGRQTSLTNDLLSRRDIFYILLCSNLLKKNCYISWRMCVICLH